MSIPGVSRGGFSFVMAGTGFGTKKKLGKAHGIIYSHPRMRGSIWLGTKWLTGGMVWVLGL
jgi:hypothetical protein